MSLQPLTPPTQASPCSATLAPLLCILALGVMVRVAALGWWGYHQLPTRIWDENDYRQLAVSIAEHGTFAFADGRPTCLRPPLYSAVVAAVYKVCGQEHYLFAVRALQNLLSLVNVVVVFYLASEAFSRRVGLWAAGLFCFYPSFVLFSNLLLTETLFTLLLSLVCLAVVRFYRRNTVGYLALAGFLLGLGALTRSVLWLAPPFLALFVLLTWRAGFPRRLLAAGLMAAAFAATIAPWSVRCTRLEQTFVAIDTMGGRNFMMGNYEYTFLYRSWATIDVGLRHPERGWDNVVRQADPSFDEMTQGQKDKRALKYGLDFVKRNPGLTAYRDVIKCLQFWGLERTILAGAIHPRSYFGPLPRPVVGVLAALILGGYVFALFSGIFGILMAPPGDRRLHWFFLLVIGFIWGIHMVVFAHERYHLPLMPLVLMYAASAVVHARDLWQRRGRPAFWLAGALCLLLVAAWGWVDVYAYATRSEEEQSPRQGIETAVLRIGQGPEQTRGES